MSKPKGAQTASQEFSDGSNILMGSAGKAVHQDPPLCEGDTLFRQDVEASGSGATITYRERTVRSVDSDENSVLIGSGRYALDKLATFANDPTIDKWHRERPEALPADAKYHVEQVDTYVPNVPSPPTPKALDWMPLSGEGSQKEANEFLEGGPDGQVDHQLGGVSKWIAAFAGRYAGTTLSLIVIGPPYNPAQNGDGIATITRLANHPNAPHNTSSWMIARVREWAAANDFDKLVAYAGVGENRGTCYDGAGFEREETTKAEGDGRKNREGRSAVRSGEEWTRHKWVCDL